LNENERLRRLHELRVLDTAPEALFDALVQAAAAITGMPMSLLSLMDQHRQWFKANHGLPGVSSTPRDMAFCHHVVTDSRPVEVHDARTDPRFANNPMVTGEPGIRAYAGFPIRTSDGIPVGSLCVLGPVPGTLTDGQREALARLAQAASLALESRLELMEQRDRAEHEAAEARRLATTSQALETELRERQQFLQRTGQLTRVGGWELDLVTHALRWSEQTCAIHEVPADYIPPLDEALSFYPPGARLVIQKAVERCLAEGEPWDLELPLVTARGRRIWVRTVGAREAKDGRPVRLAGAIQDVTDRRRALEALQASERRFRQLFEYSLSLICTHDLEGILLSVNPAAANSLGYAVHQMLGRSLTEFMPARRRAGFADYLQRIATQGMDAGVMELEAADGGQRYWRYQNLREDSAEGPYVLGSAQDITEEHRYQRLLVEWSTRDPLTKAFNRRYLERLEQWVADGRRWGCVVLDLDHFKAINDSFGHARGDETLIATATLLGDCCRDEDAVVRLGGDEFLLVVSDPLRLPALSADIQTKAAQRGIGVSTGWAKAEPREPVAVVVARADEVLYAQRLKRRAAQ